MRSPNHFAPVSAPPFSRLGCLLFAAVVALSTNLASASAEDIAPDRLFIQVGVGEGASMVVAGAAWDWSWRRLVASGTATGYWEVSLGRWEGRSDEGHASAWVTQIGVTPVVRWELSNWPSGMFIEAGIGVNLLAPIYRSGNKRFSTVFNFGDHIGFGRCFGDRMQHELTLRIQHFSNGGVKRPNPGEDFLQIHYSRRW